MSSCLSFNDLNYEIWSKRSHSSFPCLGSRSGDVLDEKTSFVRIHFPFTNDVIMEAHFKCIYRPYLSLSNMHRIFKGNWPNCPRRKIEEGTFMHLFFFFKLLAVFFFFQDFAKNCTLLLWKNESPPAFKMLLDQISEFLPLKKSTLDEHNRDPIF